MALEGTGLVVLHAGVLDGDAGTRPLRHIFVGQAAAWHAITDDLPRFEDRGPRPRASDTP